MAVFHQRVEALPKSRLNPRGSNIKHASFHFADVSTAPQKSERDVCKAKCVFRHSPLASISHPKPSFLLSNGCVLENFSMSAYGSLLYSSLEKCPFSAFLGIWGTWMSQGLTDTPSRCVIEQLQPRCHETWYCFRLLKRRRDMWNKSCYIPSAALQHDNKCQPKLNINGHIRKYTWIAPCSQQHDFDWSA